MRAQEARELGKRIAHLVEGERVDQAYALLAPVLAERTPFRLLDLIGEAVGAGSIREARTFADRIAAHKTEGGWVVIASALRRQLDRDPKGAFALARRCIVWADVWYATDILGERVPGPALVADFERALALLAPWRDDENRWVRRTLGVATHFWAKCSRGAPELAESAQALLALLAPMFGEWEMDAVKGVGWGLKTLGRHYPDLVANWLPAQIAVPGRRHRALMLRKALTYLSDEQRVRATGEKVR